MKTLFTTLLLCFSLFLSGQITMTADDFPMPADTFELNAYLNVTKPTNYNNQSWNYVSLSNPAYATAIFQREELEDFTNVGIDVYRSVSKNFNKDFIYYIDIEFDLNDNALSEKGLYIPEQRYALTSFTGNNKDSLIIPLQGYIFGNTVDHLRFPLTHKKAWASQSRRQTDFALTVNAFNIKNVPAKHVWYSMRKDTVIGYGTMQILTPNGPSKTYDVLVDRIESHTVDSFYLGGQPAPLALLNGFGISQGQKTNIANRINFYRKDLFYYFASFYFGEKPFTAQPSDFFTCYNGAELVSSTKDNTPIHSITVYPTVLSSGQSVNVLMQSDNITTSNLKVLNADGQVMQSANINSSQIEEVQLTNLIRGIYFLKITDEKQNIISTQKIVIQ